MTATYIRHLTGAAEGHRIERHGLQVRWVGPDGDILRSVHCGNENDAKHACYWMADDAYREAEYQAREPHP